ncbi:undecaprenyldiphospho-muramoylpentapeptide beta-N-acetylglucosaminyltransferase [Buchnera aphidicola]|uniref:UDP-N-acetylglucosamine--N-acetylmuramyl-(pentapeptide) pyrophosphoryl-undecaprenol N-acetylglucosamine transferase n=1 Tax=Buchnera aphidicola subsp. Schizaphis graminum (strain Sg) TaxID=198804 RepID=MURG_BUCAP|nr:undecaprenyldiphospho-muramoylpentapeptide beta-N-acetylglucosaminyltransferase [Buchnera aphidicola]Q8K9T4.1 RecName: Full=UDP-N-acetylglucosamine--N-acetylmuramyl-(pentapeptide) pyrophosphoryl-undecaprenol N-acetylglucosamine transferase; AltName: Full=Undecaprenyl-PP-MurNAc-pentapeptide-UDPGlcNAc GlcNAc transferase [Buchnera aphidicola str. Sg (Schizaphis graminum)]AAM67773.1 UDP-N-acetylglucosamine--N-acetylmuramyl-(pentapeptide) pyrophosphoryl-undecaprenol N-acetylglucosamine transferase 
MNSKRIIILAGGSGGHVFPGLTIAKHLIKKGWDINWIGTKNKIESEIIPKCNIKIHFIKIQGLRNSSLKNLIMTPINVLNSYLQVRKIIKNWIPDIILGMGGYVSGPGGLAAWSCKIPFILHEQNKIAGITNKLLSKISTKNMQAFSGTLLNAEIVGNPIRKNIIDIPPPIKRFKNRKGPLRILIIGGSQGASIFNKILPKISFFLQEKAIIWHQSGNNDLQKTRKKYKKYSTYKHIVSSFIKNIAEAYEWADIIISRSGALTVSEITVVGLGAIFIPYPHKDKQQYLNAEDLENNGAAKIIEQSMFTAELIIKILNSLNREKLFIMAKKAYSLGIRNSTSKISKIIHDVSNKI